MTDGSLISESLRALSRYAAEIEVLYATLPRLMQEEFKRQQAGGICYREAGKPMSRNRTDDASHWFCTDVAWSLPLCSKRRRKDDPEMYLGFQISLMGDGTDCVTPPEPILHVFFWDVPVDFTEYWVAYPRDAESKLGGERALIYWDSDGANWQRRQWTFSVKLLSLDSSTALNDRIVAPAFRLLDGASETEALPLDFSGLVRHPSST